MNLRPFIGIPYVDRGSSFQGCDCWGLVWLFHVEVLNTLVPRYDGYASAEGPDIPDRICAGWEQWTQVEPAAIEVGDVLALRLGRVPLHCGVYIGQGRMLHTLKGRMSCTEEVQGGFWSRSIVRIGRWKS
jgi:cell wall-associated NlpC family hydrolase